MEISVVIPLYNKANEIGRALQSVKDQTVSPSEIIVVDDGSTDGGADVVKTFQLHNLRLVRQDNRGECAARNRGIQEAHGDLIAFLDADDFWKSSFIAALSQLEQQFPQCGIFGTAWQFMYPDGRQVVPRFYGVPPVNENGVIDCYYDTIAFGMGVCASSMAVRREAFDRCGLFPEGVKLGGDRETLIRLAAEYEVGFRNEILVTVCLGASNRVSNNYRRGVEHPIIATGIEILSREQLNPKARHALMHYVASTAFHKFHDYAAFLFVARGLPV